MVQFTAHEVDTYRTGQRLSETRKHESEELEGHVLSRAYDGAYVSRFVFEYTGSKTFQRQMWSR